MKCPKCSSHHAVRAKRSFGEKLLPNSKKYYCTDCKTKYLKFSILGFSFYISDTKRTVEAVH